MKDQVKILICGDFCPVGRSEKLINNFALDETFGDLIPIIRESDISITNLECPLTNSKNALKKTGPNLKASLNVARFLKEAGFNLVTLANNHIMDYGVEGLNSTIKACSEESINYTGVGNNLKEARLIHYHEHAKIKIAFINICENEWSTANGDAAGANPLNPITNYYDIKEAREKADYVFVILHGNNEMYQLPSPRIKELCHFYIDSGANFVICHHSHVYSGFEMYNNGMIFYGLGNFLFDKPKFRDHNWNNGIIIQICIDQKRFHFKIIPVRQSNNKPGTRLIQENEDAFNRIKHLNSIIVNDYLLNEEFVKFCANKSTMKIYNGFLEPYSNKYLIGLYKRNFLPSLISKGKRMLLLNLIRCESHRDVLRILLNN